MAPPLSNASHRHHLYCLFAHMSALLTAELLPPAAKAARHFNTAVPLLHCLCMSLQHTSAVDSSPLPPWAAACAILCTKAGPCHSKALVFTNDAVPAVQADAYELPIKLDCDLRSYQREGISWLAFLKRTGLHGCLADVSDLHLCAHTDSCLEQTCPVMSAAWYVCSRGCLRLPGQC